MHSQTLQKNPYSIIYWNSFKGEALGGRIQLGLM